MVAMETMWSSRSNMSIKEKQLICNSRNSHSLPARGDVPARLPVGIGDQSQAAVVPGHLPQNGEDEEQHLQTSTSC